MLRGAVGCAESELASSRVGELEEPARRGVPVVRFSRLLRTALRSSRAAFAALLVEVSVP